MFQLIFLTIFTVATAMSGRTIAATGEIPAESAFHVLADMNSPSPVQPASCHGSWGMDLGVGMEYFVLPGINPVLLEQVGLGRAATPTENMQFATPRLWLTKGFTLPIDFSLSMAAPGQDQDMLQVTAILQWTLYQALGRPAIALRGAHGQLQGHFGTKLSSTGGEAVLSFGFWRFFTLYGAAGVWDHRGSIYSAPITTDELGISESLKEVSYNLGQFKTTGTTGIKVNLWSPFASLSGETSFNSSRNYTVKLSYLL